MSEGSAVPRYMLTLKSLDCGDGDDRYIVTSPTGNRLIIEPYMVPQKALRDGYWMATRDHMAALKNRGLPATPHAPRPCKDQKHCAYCLREVAWLRADI